MAGAFLLIGSTLFVGGIFMAITQGPNFGFAALSGLGFSLMQVAIVCIAGKANYD